MWMYHGTSDPMRAHPEELDAKALEAKLMTITSIHDNPRGTRVIIPFDKENHRLR